MLYINSNLNQSFRSGIFESDTCDGINYDHAMLLVGYGQEEQTGKKYWIIKNR